MISAEEARKRVAIHQDLFKEKQREEIEKLINKAIINREFIITIEDLVEENRIELLALGYKLMDTYNVTTIEW